MIRRSTLPLLALLALGACSKDDTEQKAPIQTVPVERRDIVIDAEATGTVEPINVIEVKSKASGQIVAMPVETGTQVKPGDLLVQVDTRDVRSQYEQALADVRAAEARLEVTSQQKRRSDELFASRVITAQEHEAAQLEFANAQAQRVRSRASLDQAQQRLEDATVRAPVAGTVIEKTVSLGQVITSATGAFGGGTTLLKMADLGQVRVRALVNETDIGQLQPGQEATVVVDAYPERPFRGTVEKVEPQAVVNQSVTQFPVLISLQNREGLLRPGMNGEVSILIDRRENVLAIPNDAVRNPREAMAAATALGLNPEDVQKAMQAQFAGRGGSGGPGGPGAPAGPAGPAGPTAPGGDTARRMRVAGNGGGAPPGEMPRRGGTPSGGGMQGRGGEPRTGGDGGGAGGAGGAAGGAGGGGGAAGQMGGGMGGGRGRTGLVFVPQNGSYAPKIVRLGASNYDHSEVVGGLQEGEQVALLAAATLQAQRQQNVERFRGMTGGGVPGMSRQQPQQGGAPAAAPAGGGRGPRP